MAQKRPRRRSQRAEPTAPEDAAAPREPANPAASGKHWPPAAPVTARSGREVRPYIYAGFDFAAAAVYSVVLLVLAPTRHPLHATLLWSAVAAVALAGAGMLWRNRWGWRIAAAGCALLLLLAIVLLVLILLSASFLAGVYGSMGQGAAMMALLAGALVIELIALLPAFQLKFLLTRAGQRHYARPAGRSAESAP